MQDILLKHTPKDKAKPVNIGAFKHGQYGYVRINDMLLVSSPTALCNQLRALIAVLETVTVAQRANQLPPELAEPETGWPFLVARFPWLFDGINLSAEPYASYLKGSQAGTDAALIRHLDNPTQADVAEVLFNDRTKTGGSYRRRILAALEAATTTENNTTTPYQLKNAA